MPQLNLAVMWAQPGSLKRSRGGDNEIDGRGDGKTPIKPGKKMTLNNRTTQRATSNNEQPSSSRKRSLASGSRGLSSPSRSNTIKGRSTIDLTSSDSPPRLSHTNRIPVPYLPTPVTTTKYPAKQARERTQRTSPVTPTKVRSIPKGSGLLSPPPSSQLGFSPTEDIITTSPAAPPASPNTRSGTVVPSSQTQVLEINPFLSPKRTSPRQHGTFKLPKLPPSSTIRAPAFNLNPTVNDDDDDEDTCVIPSSQTQELVYHRPLTPPSRLHIHNEDPTAGEIIPDSQPPEHEVHVAYSPARRRTQSDDTSGEHTQRDIVPTSQSIFEKEISSSDLLDIKSRFPVQAEPSSALDHSKAPDTTTNNVLTSTPTRTRFYSASNPCTPTSAHCHRVFGQDSNTRPSLAPLQKLTTTPRTPRSPQKTPHSVRFTTPPDSPSKLAALAIPGSSQTEPESSQWHVPTQHTQRSPSRYAHARAHDDDSSQTEPEESQYHVPTQHIPIQSSQSSVSSMTEPESSQYHVPTQYTPRGHHRLGAPRFDVDVSDEEEEEEEDELARGSLPIASYPDHDESDEPPPSSSTRRDPPSPLPVIPIENPTTTFDRDDGSDFGFSQVELSREALERLEHVRSRLGIVHTGRLLDSQFSVSGVSVSGSAFSIPSDYWSCEES